MVYIPRGTKEASLILAKSFNFLVYYDPDPDGVISGELSRRFLTAFGKPYMYYINDNRTHGMKLTEAQITELSAIPGICILLVDAAMSLEDIKLLTSKGINVINIDHHHLDYEELVYYQDPDTGKEGVIINNQYPFEPEEQRYLSGGGMVYHVLNGLYPDFCGLDEKALVGLSLLSDIRPIESPLAQDFLHTTYTHKSPQMDYLVSAARSDRDFGFGVQTFDRNFIDYTFSPKINALFRLNKGDEAIKLFQGQFNDPTALTVYRNIQNAIVEVIVENLEGDELSNLVSKGVESTLSTPYDYDITNFIGLACSRVKNFGKTSFLYVRENGKVKRGSVRGQCDDINYLELFRKYGFDADGHNNAFGVKAVDFDSVDIQGLNQEIAELEAGYTERKYKDRIFEVNNLDFFVKSRNSQMADHNNYVRDAYRWYIKYTGSNIERYQKGKAIEFVVDGVKVLSFDPDLSIENDLILPVRERGSYIQFYLKRY